MVASLLAGLNEAQKAAVTSTAPVLQVLAPPGSGKTKTLTSRVAHLISHCQLDPHNVICCTFTIKASREMRERLRGLVGESQESKLILGTFHSICRRYLAAYGHKIGIPKGFSIADSSDSKSMIKKIIKKGEYKIEPNTARNKISGCKARFRTADVLREEQAKAKNTSENQQELISVYTEYEAELERNNLLDYDDLLLRCVDLLRKYPLCVANVEAVLVDEFQDTNIVQFELMKLFASSRGNVTIVGDPDQSIYGFRSAEIANLKRMQDYYLGTAVINLEENYRSAAAVLNLAQDVIEQDKDRPAKKLKSTHCYGSLPVLRRLSDPRQEGLWIAAEVKRMMATTGGLIDPSDIAVLIRSGYLSLQIERGLTNAGIAYRMVGGMRFFDRAEIRLIIDYMRTVAHPDNNAAFLSIINVPSRKIGETAINGFVKLAEEHDASVWRIVQKVVTGSLNLEKKLTTPAQNDLAKLVNLIKRADDKMKSYEPPSVPAQLISYLFEALKIPVYLQQKYKDDYEDRLENVQELVAHAVEHASMTSNVETLPTVDGAIQQEVDKRQEALDQFLANIVLSSEVEDKTDDKPRVTISTIHSAKGLEWPVVFVPAVYEGSIPHSRAEDNDEERRLLYVAITRAKALLNMSMPLYSSREQQKLDLTQFLPQDIMHRTAEKAPSFNDSLVRDVATILRRDMPSQEDLARGVASIAERESVEDDIWPIDGREPLGPEQNSLLNDQRSPGQGMSLHEAEQRSKSAYQNKSGFQTAPYGYQTSMANANSFSTANTSMNTGFTTANQQLRSWAPSAPAPLGTQNVYNQTAKQGPAPAKTSGGIRDFFASKSQSAGPSPAEEARQAWSRKASTSSPTFATSTSHSRPSVSAPAPPARSLSDLAPELTTHRLGSATLGASFGRTSAPGRVAAGGGIAGFKRPRPLPLSDVSPNTEHKRQHYTFLSSSPTREEPEPGMLGDVVDLTGGEGEEGREKENRGAKKTKTECDADSKLAATDRTTETMVKRPITLAGKAISASGSTVMSSLPGAGAYPKKRSLGVNKGPLVPWSQRKNK